MVIVGGVGLLIVGRLVQEKPIYTADGLAIQEICAIQVTLAMEKHFAELVILLQNIELGLLLTLLGEGERNPPGKSQGEEELLPPVAICAKGEKLHLLTRSGGDESLCLEDGIRFDLNRVSRLEVVGDSPLPLYGFRKVLPIGSALETTFVSLQFLS